jgi:uncharacterized DUF497 family protein
MTESAAVLASLATLDSVQYEWDEAMNDVIRIISVRKATKNEEISYFGTIAD